MNRQLTLLVAALVLAAPAFAQQPTSAEANPPGTPQPAATPKATPAEKVAGKQTRRAAGREEAHAPKLGEAGTTAVPEKTEKVARAERQAARAARKAETTRANKAGEITSRGETGITR